jgi:ABC-type amino acid transport substrate-binding protein
MNDHSKIGWLVLWGALVLPGIVGAQALNFVVPEYEPFTGTVGGKAAGIGIDLAAKVFKEAGITPTVQVVSNFARCISEVQTGNADGFYIGSKAADRDAVAVLSDKVLVNRWVWVLPATSALDPKAADFKAKAKVGVILNSNPNTWLKDHGFAISGTPPNVAGLLTMLDANRFNAVLVPELIFQDGLKAAGKTADGYKSVLEVEQPMGIYLSKKTLAANPGLMDKVNAAIKKLGL